MQSSYYGALIINHSQVHYKEKSLKIALVYGRKSGVGKNSEDFENATPARKISASLAHEKKMLSLINVFAIMPI